MSEETIFGFFKEYIRGWLIKECLESGSHPEHFWWALQEVFHELEEEIEDNSYFWDEVIGVEESDSYEETS